MKKTSFYTMMRQQGKARAVLKDGYSDGTYYYYKSDYCGTWHAIHPLNGLSVAYGYTRKKAAEKAHSPELERQLLKYMAEQGTELTKRYEKAIYELKTDSPVQPLPYNR